MFVTMANALAYKKQLTENIKTQMRTTDLKFGKTSLKTLRKNLENATKSQHFRFISPNYDRECATKVWCLWRN